MISEVQVIAEFIAAEAGYCSRAMVDQAAALVQHLNDNGYVVITASSLRKMEDALRYIERPTMSLRGADPEAHAMVADEYAVRLALQTCIRTAREALAVEARRER